jgi:DNA polymerase-1
MLASFMNDKEYTNEILNGDIHTTNQNNAGLSTRAQAKTFIYAFLYGAGDAKIGSIVDGSQRTGANLDNAFSTILPHLQSLESESHCLPTRLPQRTGRTMLTHQK